MTKRNMVLLIVIALVALAIDQAAKLLIVRTLQTPGNSIHFIDNFISFVLTYNRAGVFGLNLGRGLTYFIFPALGILLVVLFASSAQHFGFTFSYALILGGAFGNLIDRLFRKEGVVDFISLSLGPLGIKWRVVNPWFIFNFADLWLVLGIILLLLFELFTGRNREGAPEAASATGPVSTSDTNAPGAGSQSNP